MSYIEIIATFFAFIYIALTIAELQISWLVAILSSVLYIFLFWQSSLYYQSILQIFFILSSFYGWWAWDPKRETEIKISTHTAIENAYWIAGSFAITLPASIILEKISDSPAPTLDALTTVFSVSATILTAHKKIESWWYWIAIDLLSIWMFVSQKLFLTATVYAGFTALAVFGLNSWLKKREKI